jgi:hypothetical protein
MLHHENAQNARFPSKAHRFSNLSFSVLETNRNNFLFSALFLAAGITEMQQQHSQRSPHCLATTRYLMTGKVTPKSSTG